MLTNMESRTKNRTLALLLFLLLLQSACIEVQLAVKLNADGSGTLVSDYVIDKRLVMGRFAAFEKNDLLPLSYDELVRFAERFDGVQIVDSRFEDLAAPSDIKVPKATTAEVGNRFLRRVHYVLDFENINALQTNHFRFADYLDDGRRIFAFVIRKHVPEGTTPDQRLNDLADVINHRRNLTLGVALPAAPIRHNGTSIALTKVQWVIPIPAIMSDPQPTIIAWAEMRPPAAPGLGGTWQRLNLWLQGRQFPSADELPVKLLDNPIYFESRPELKQ